LEAAEYFDIWFDKNRIIFETEMLAEKYFLTNPADAVSIGVGSGLFASKASSVKEMREVIDISFLLSTSSLKSYPEAITAVLPCFWSYAEIADHHRNKLSTNQNRLYKDWAEVYTTDSYLTLVEKIIYHRKNWPDQ